MLLAEQRTQGPRARGLVVSLRSLILDGRLLPGSRLPAERALAARLGLSRTTISAAYDELRAEGYLISRRGDGTFVELPSSEALTRPDEQRLIHQSGLIDLTIAAPPAPAQLGSLAEAAAHDLHARLAGSGLEPAGIAPLRAIIARGYTERGVPTEPEEVLITSGALHAWDMLLRAFVRPGAHVVIEQPTYPAVIDAALAHRARLHPLPVDADGWDAEALTQARSAVLAHLTFDGQNPTGNWANEATRERVIAAFPRTSTLVVDETMITYRHPPTPPPKAGDGLSARKNGATIVVIGSMSKSFWAGLRVGWIRAPAPLIRRLAAVRAGQDLAPPVLEQLLCVRLLAEAGTVLPERRAMVAERRAALLDILARHAPHWRVAPPQGGLHAWIDLGPHSSTELTQSVRPHGVRITPGTRFTIHGSHDRFVRIPFVLAPQQLEDAVRRLVAAAERLPPAQGRRHPGGAETAWSI